MDAGRDERRHRWFERMATILLAVAAVATSWAVYALFAGTLV